MTSPGPTPTLREERRLLRSGHRFVAGMDEVGRGALAGPVTVGTVVVDLDTPSAPVGVRDSKLLTPAARTALVPALRGWATTQAVGHASPEEIDRLGIVGALRLAGHRALAALTVQPDCVLLDGSHDWLSAPAPTLFDDAPADDDPVGGRSGPRVVTMVKADRRCATVAAASVLAKVERDGILDRLSQEFVQYGWERNKGYGAAEHLAALRRHGPCAQHRRSWRLPSADTVPDGATGPAPGRAPGTAHPDLLTEHQVLLLDDPREGALARRGRARDDGTVPLGHDGTRTTRTYPMYPPPTGRQPSNRSTPPG